MRNPSKLTTAQLEQMLTARQGKLALVEGKPEYAKLRAIWQEEISQIEAEIKSRK